LLDVVSNHSALGENQTLIENWLAQSHMSDRLLLRLPLVLGCGIWIYNESSNDRFPVIPSMVLSRRIHLFRGFEGSPLLPRVRQFLRSPISTNCTRTQEDDVVVLVVHIESDPGIVTRARCIRMIDVHVVFICVIDTQTETSYCDSE
jgi:hypothetical protein